MARRGKKPSSSATAPGARQGAEVALGWLSMLPLFAAYEIGRASAGTGLRNFAEALLSTILAPLGYRAALARWLLLAFASVLAGAHLARSERALLARIGRVVLEGALAAVLLGPALALLFWMLGLPADPHSLRAGEPLTPPPLTSAAVLCAGAAWEELVFRLGLQSALYLLLRRALLALGLGPDAATLTAELGALVLGALAFAAAHLSGVVAWVGPGGEPFDAALFSWRATAGILLGILFRWRGMGVAAWAHALFNLALYIGAGPDVFL